MQHKISNDIATNVTDFDLMPISLELFYWHSNQWLHIKLPRKWKKKEEMKGTPSQKRAFELGCHLRGWI